MTALFAKVSQFNTLPSCCFLDCFVTLTHKKSLTQLPYSKSRNSRVAKYLLICTCSEGWYNQWSHWLSIWPHNNTFCVSIHTRKIIFFVAMVLYQNIWQSTSKDNKKIWHMSVAHQYHCDLLLNRYRQHRGDKQQSSLTNIS